MNFLMLDDEGTLLYNYGSLSVVQYVVRPYAKELLDWCILHFNKVWLNTRVPEELTRLMMKRGFGYEGTAVWRRSGSKTASYGAFAGHTLVHVEDGVPDSELEDMRRLGVHYVPVSTYAGDKDDKELLEALGVIKNILREPTC